MKLILDSGRPLRAAYFTEEGAAAYQICPDPDAGLLDRKTLIKKMDAQSGQFLPLAEFELHNLSPDRLRMGGTFDETADTIFTREHGTEFSGDDRLFLGPDNREYRWRARSRKSELITNDGTGTLVAKFHNKHYEIFSCIQEPGPASLEILPLGMQMIDFIMLTYAYVETKRQEYQRARRRRNARRRRR
ncbi:hypothetical protein FA15DRAFT_673099 [Coprinopsis marcescibilis]|uniref:DUF6593 domain-containing protein n=1 Tax=Coprinopsis marcescibilis TaxID=230819 RepID=A0A5C3KY85_COPMA|nr:hypothetical protein FA15DRAFT_673099 [Coprinopsis marcescibilis]